MILEVGDTFYELLKRDGVTDLGTLQKRRKEQTARTSDMTKTSRHHVYSCTSF